MYCSLARRQRVIGMSPASLGTKDDYQPRRRKDWQEKLFKLAKINKWSNSNKQTKKKLLENIFTGNIFDFNDLIFFVLKSWKKRISKITENNFIRCTCFLFFIRNIPNMFEIFFQKFSFWLFSFMDHQKCRL